MWPWHAALPHHEGSMADRIPVLDLVPVPPGLDAVRDFYVTWGAQATAAAENHLIQAESQAFVQEVREWAGDQGDVTVGEVARLVSAANDAIDHGADVEFDVPVL